MLGGAKLPNTRQVIAYFFHRHFNLKEGIRTSSKASCEAVLEFWAKANIPVQAKQHVITKIEKVFAHWKALQKHSRRTTAAHKAKEGEFLASLGALFDIAHQNAMNMMTIQEDKDFLLAQREDDRRGVLGSVDRILVQKNKKAEKRSIAAERRHQRATVEKEAFMSKAVITSSSSSSTDTDSDPEHGVGRPLEAVVPVPPPAKRARVANIVTPRLAAALDRTKTSSRCATFILAEAASSLGHNIEDLNINYSSIHRKRIEYRTQAHATPKLKDELQDVPLIVHWDGKLMKDITGNQHVDRLPVLISGNGTGQLLCVAKLPSGRGNEQANAILSALKDWGLEDRIAGMGFDTTASNTGKYSGTCVILQQKLTKDLLHLACRHHVLELVLGAAFTASMGTMSGPDVLLFKRFQQHWHIIDHGPGSISPGADSAEVEPFLSSGKDNLTAFFKDVLHDKNLSLRDDYSELVELSLIFLGGTPPRGLRLLTPGPMHHARWMSKAIYSLKVWMLRTQFKLTPREEKGLRDICIFVVLLYVKAWIRAPLAAVAPQQDLEMLKAMAGYHNKTIAKATASKLSHHLWYLSEELVAMALFDPLVSTTTKRAMVEAISNKEGAEEPPKRINLKEDSVSSSRLEDFCSKNSKSLFTKLGLPYSFLLSDPETWESNIDFKTASSVISNLKVVNDNAERGVALIQEYNCHLTRDEDQLQFLLQVVSEHRLKYPDSRKKTLLRHQ
jgi:hypothetical protein